MSANPITQSKEPSLAEIAKFDELMRLYQQLNRATARTVLDALDKRMPPGDERREIRDILLKRLAHNNEEMNRWLAEQGYVATSTELNNAYKPSS